MRLKIATSILVISSTFTAGAVELDPQGTAFFESKVQPLLSGGPGQSRLGNNVVIFQCITVMAGERERPGCGPHFCPAARIAVLDSSQNGERLIASRQYGLY